MTATRKRTAARIDHYVLRRAAGGTLDINLPDERTTIDEIRQSIRRLEDAGLIHAEPFRRLDLHHLTVPADRRDEVELRLALIDTDAAHGYGQARFALTGRQHGPDALEVADAIYAPLDELPFRRCTVCDGSGQVDGEECAGCGASYLAGWIRSEG